MEGIWQMERNMPQYKLTYLDLQALGEPIRFMLHYMGKEFEDNRMPFEQVFHLKSMPEIPFGKVPVLEIDDKVIHQCPAILRFLAIEAGLSGDDAQENLEIDMIVGAFGDLITEIQRYAKTQNQEEKEKIKDYLVKINIPYYMERIEGILKNDGYLANGKLSWADLYVVASGMSVPRMVGVDLSEEYPMFKELVDKIQSLPGIKEWVEKRPSTPF